MITLNNMKMKSSKNTKNFMGGCSIYLWSAMVACTLILLLLGLRNSFGAEEMSVEIPITVFHSKVTSIHPPSLRSTRIASGQTEELCDQHRFLRETAMPPSTNPTAKHSESPSDSSTLSSDGSVSSYDTAPAVMMAMASTVLIRAVALYFYDLRDRCCRRGNGYGMWCCNGRDAIDSSTRSWMGRLWCRKSCSTMEQNGSFPRLPPGSSPDEDWECVESIALSPVSTITASFVMDHGVSTIMNHCDSDVDLAESKDIKELTDLDRVPGGIILSNLVDLSQMNVIAVYGDSEQRSHETSMNSQGDNMSLERSPSDFETTRIDTPTLDLIFDTEEDESGWTSADANSADSSDTSIGTYLKSAHSGRSRSSSMRSMALFSASSIALRRSKSRDETVEMRTENAINAQRRDQRQYPFEDKRDGPMTKAARNSTLLEYWLERNHLPIQEFKGRDSSDDESTEIHDSSGSHDAQNPFIARSSTSDMDLQDHVVASGFTSARRIGRERNFRKPCFKGDDILNSCKCGKTSCRNPDTDPRIGGCLPSDSAQSLSPWNESILRALDDPDIQSELGSLDAVIEGSAIEV